MGKTKGSFKLKVANNFFVPLTKSHLLFKIQSNVTSLAVLTTLKTPLRSGFNLSEKSSVLKLLHKTNEIIGIASTRAGWFCIVQAFQFDFKIF